MGKALENLDSHQKKTMKIVIAYPMGVAAVSILLNLLILEVSPFTVSLPNYFCLLALSISAIIFCINHTWLMTATELTRVRYKMRTTPEEWKNSEVHREDISDHARYELERVHNAHRNTSENTLYFSLLALPFIFTSPSNLAAVTWLILFSLARVGYTYSYLNGKDEFRSGFMTLGLLAMYGIASYIFLSLVWSGGG
ncbi:MAPEG family protein [Exilibacterium tricleocarpae]|uniref:MAPEG family protein n=1 Tax=Exilibacterium tricleocarpae TaxID=2591008 RepID=A0A545TZK1_9GAMM|nr:MAPEG family protein [Exilibacterium tricleocarpae]TQV82641.1 MAPEG family protein [Exilibacterium tricleocarpae]